MAPPILRIFALTGVALAAAGAQVIDNEQSRANLRSVLERALSGPFEPLVGLAGPVVKNRPYSATVTTETTQALAGGGHIRQQSSYRIARDGNGRIRQENTTTGRVFLSDPVGNATYLLSPQTRTAQKMPLGTLVLPAGGAAYESRREAVEPRSPRRPASNAESPEKDGLTKTEDLGIQVLGGVAARGERTSVNVPVGTLGNDVPLQIVRERWYSAELQIAVLTRHSDPRTGEAVVKYVDIHLGEPDAAWFQVPAGYKVSTEAGPAQRD
ncbi:MAG: hypothetical protein LAQ69_38255 [Acidobacteriia bacterium]|nr:hypothetical protein [Terriglobia bacterium]